MERSVEVLITEFVKDPRTYATAIALFAWWSDRKACQERAKNANAQFARVLDELLAVLRAVKGGQ